jgi:two-component system, LytTR family, sensor kinase
MTAKIKNRLIRFGIVFASWSLLAIFLAVNRALYRITVGRPTEFVHFLSMVLLDYWIWVALTLLIFYFSQRFQFTRTTWVRSTIVHCGCCVLITFLHEVGSHVLRLPLQIPEGFQGSPFKLRIVASLYEDLWMYWSIVVVWSLFEYYQRYRERDIRATRLSEQLARAELQGLRSQLHPHFLFNTLNSIAALLHRDVDAADDMIADLGYLLRVYLAGETEQEISLDRELQLLNTYIRIQQRRFQDRLSWSTDLEEGLLHAAVPPLLLQPLVENAILHGIAPRSSPGWARVTVRKEESNLLIEVADNGVGLGANYTEGLGLSNTRSRLKQLYGDKHSFVLRGDNAGVIITITLPLRVVCAEKIDRYQASACNEEVAVQEVLEDPVATHVKV